LNGVVLVDYSVTLVLGNCIAVVKKTLIGVIKCFFYLELDGQENLPDTDAVHVVYFRRHDQTT
jgi:hypothetical protein